MKVAILSAVRTPIGKFAGTLSSLTSPQLGAIAVRAALERADIRPDQVELVILGLARQAGCGPNPARQVGVAAGIPHSSPAYTINQACASGLSAIAAAARHIRAGEARVVVAAGAESMSRVPYLLDQVRFGHKIGHTPLTDAMYRDGLLCPMAGKVMGETVEALADEFSISRQEQDEYAARSQQRCQAAQEEGRFADELVAVEAGKVKLEQDEHPRAGTTSESLARLKPVFSDTGTITAGNSSGITDGASALVLVDADWARDRKPLAYLEECVTVGLDPARMGLGPVEAVGALLKRTGGSLNQFDLIELNEAFAAQVLACDRKMPLPHDRLNVNGGSIALGHPIGCSGNRITVTLLHQMKRQDARAGLATLCVSGGLGIAARFTR